jgi:serine/threonine protein kinase
MLLLEMPRRRTRKKGGASIIGQGAYGCVYRPALACEGNSGPRQGEVSKLVSKKNVEEEYASYDILRGIDPGRELYAYPVELCPFHAASQTPETLNTLLMPEEKAALTPNPLIATRNNYERIEAMKSSYRRQGKKCAITNVNEGSIIQMPDAGSTFNQLKLSKSDVYGFFEGFENILQSVKVLHEAGYFHHDIKPDNILIQRVGSSASFKFRLADFGTMRSLAKSLETYKAGGHVNGIYHAPYPYWPLYVIFLNFKKDDLINFLNGVDYYNKGMQPNEEKTVKYIKKVNLMVAENLANHSIVEPAYSVYKNGVRQSRDELNDIGKNVYRIFYEKVKEKTSTIADSYFTNFLKNIDTYSLAMTLNLYVNSIFNSICLFNANDKSTYTIAYKYRNKYYSYSDYIGRLTDDAYKSWLNTFTVDVVFGFYNIVINFMNTKQIYKLLPIDVFIGDYMTVLGKFKAILDNDVNNYFARFMKDNQPAKIIHTPTPAPAPAPAPAPPVYSPNVNNSKTKKRPLNNRNANQAPNQKQQRINQTLSHNSQGYSPQQLTQVNEPFFPMSNQI